MQISTDKKRIGWIDAMRGFTIILVVFSHVEKFGLDFSGGGDSVKGLFSLFCLPLFFFVSGFIVFKIDEDWTADYYKGCLLKKLRVQLIPMLFFGLLYSVLIFSRRNGIAPLKSIVLFFNSSAKFGYWFTEVLLEMFLIYYTVSFLMRRHSMASRQIVLGIIAACLFVPSLFGLSTFEKYTVCNWLCTYNLLLYFQFFIFGNIVSCYRKKVFKVIENPYIIGIIVLSFFGLYFLYRPLRNMADSVFLIGMSKMLREVISYLGVITVLAIFRHYQQVFSSETRLGRGLQYIGRRTLDIYLLHYFLIPTLPAVGVFLSKADLVMETTTAIALSLLVILFCLIISNIIRVSPFLAHWLFGAKWDWHSNRHTTA